VKTIPIFKAGTHTASNGTRITFTEKQVRGMVDAYDTAKHEAPIVVGHPKTNSPAFGWVGALAYDEKQGQVIATPDQVMPEFDEAVATGRYKKRSASLYPPDSPQNPVPGQYYLRHIGFLGGQPPAIKGLEGVQYVEYAEDEKAIELADPQRIAYGTSELFRRLRDWMIDKYDLATADNVIPSWTVESLEDEARREDIPETAPVPGFTENTEELEMDKSELKAAQDKLAAAQAALVTDKAALDTQQAAFAEQQKGLIRDRMKVIATGLAAAGKIPAARAGEVAEFMAALPADISIEFGEGDKKAKKPLQEWFQDFVENVPVVKPNNSGIGDGEPGDDEGDGMTAAEMSAKILAYQEAKRKETGEEVSIVEAVRAVQAA